jgi:predicted DNA-binding transcriptional regulator YafY
MPATNPTEQLRRLLDAGHQLSLMQLQTKLNIGERQVRRLLRQLQSEGLPVHEHREGRHKLFSLSADRQQVDLPDLRFDQAELRALAVAAKASRAVLVGTPHAAALSRAFEKLLERARPVAYIFDLEEPLQEWHFEENDPDQMSEECFRQLETAMDERRSVRIDYQKAQDQSVSLGRKIDPYFFAKRGRAWLVIAWCHQRKGLRNFAIMGMKRVVFCNPDEENAFFDPPADLSPDNYFRGSLGAINSGACYELRLLVEPEKALYFHQRKYHPTQQVETVRPDGRLVVSFELEGFEEMRSFCQGWGVGITVLDPPELRRRLMEEAAELVRRYQS